MSPLRGPLLRRVLALGLAAMMLLGLLQLTTRQEVPTGQVLPALRLALDDGSVLALDGDETVVTFWGSWCGPCRREAPVLNALHAGGTRVVGIGMDPDPMPELQRKASAMGIRYPIVAERSELAKVFGVRALPTTVVVDSDRRVTFAHVGVVTEAALRDALR